MPLLQDRVQETSTTTGTGTLTLAGAVTGYRSFNASFTNGDVVFYTIDDTLGNWEVGSGTVGTGTLTRATVIVSSNANALVNFGAGAKRVFCSAPTRALLPNQTGNSGKYLTTDGTSPSWSTVGAFTTLSSTGDTTLGDAAGDTLTITAGTTTFTQGTANGVLYLNGSKVATSGSALTFDGTNLGVGTASPSYPLDVVGSNATGVGIRAKNNNGSTSSALLFAVGSGYAAYGVTAYDAWFTNETAGQNVTVGPIGAGSVKFVNNGSERMRIDSSGNVGIGTSSPSNSAKLHAVGSFISTAATLGTFNANHAGFDYITSSKIGRLFATSTDTTGGAMTFTTGNNGSYNERMRIDSSGNVGIGTSSPGAKLEVSVVSADATLNQEVMRVSTTGRSSAGVTAGRSAVISFSDSANATLTGGIGGFRTNSNVDFSGGLKFFYNGSSASSGVSTLTEGMRLDSSGNLGLGVTPNNSYNACLQLKSGITFPATQVASSNANTLDDYEEGTWTATLTDGTNTVNSDGATYRKIGNLIVISFQFYNKNISAWNAANLSVTGLPFTVATNHDSFVTTATPNGLNVSGPLVMSFTNGSASSTLYYRGGSANWAGVQKGDITNNGNFSLYLSASYTAS